MQRIVLSILVVAMLAGCASKRQRIMPATTQALSTSRPTDRAALGLNEIEPRPVLPEPSPTTRPAQVPLEALELYAHARDAMLQKQRYTAITLLEKAIKLDPGSYDLQFALADAYASVGTVNDQAIKSYEAASVLQPDHLDLQTELGREYLAKGQWDNAIERLRLAMLTREYRRDDPMSAVTEYFLARALEQRGYVQAAIDVYRRLLDRLERRGFSSRQNPVLQSLLNQPEAVSLSLGELCEKRGSYDEALEAFEFVVDRRPDAFEPQAHIVHVLTAAGRTDEAAKRATETVRQFRASNESIDLLKTVYKDRGGDAAVADQLRKLHQETPGDQPVLYTLIDVLASIGRNDEAEKTLERAAQRSGYDSQIVRRLYKLQQARGDTEAGARLVVEALARRPDSIRDLAEIWDDLLSASHRNPLTITKLQALQVSPEAQASKQLWISRLALRWHRDILARTAVEQSIKFTPPFAPAYRVLVVEYATRAEWDDARRQKETQNLADDVRRQGNEPLALELEGLALLASNRPADAVKKLAQALKLGDNAIDLRLQYATALRASNDAPKSEQVLWKLIDDEPNCEDAYAALFRHYIQAQSAQQAMPVLNRWLANMPNSINARVVQAAVLLQARVTQRAEEILLDLFEHDPDNADVLSALNEFYSRVGRVDEFISKLEAERTKHPDNYIAIEQLVSLYAQRNGLADATRVLDAARKAASSNADLLYYVGALYSRIGQTRTQEQILQQIVQLAPKYAPASNDLGYTWADRGENLKRAEELIRNAVEAEPDNQSYLDSLAWVLYKRGKFAEARKYLDQAIAPATYPDPVVLDHLGDTLYRLGAKDEALQSWRRSQQRLGQTASEREELKQLRLQLQQKIKQADAGQPVTVAPFIGAANLTPATQSLAR